MKVYSLCYQHFQEIQASEEKLQKFFDHLENLLPDVSMLIFKIHHSLYFSKC